MALRELFAKFTFDFDQAKIDQITKVTQAAEQKVAGLAAAFAPAGQAIGAVTTPLAQVGAQLSLFSTEATAAFGGMASGAVGAADALRGTAAAETELGARASATEANLKRLHSAETKVAVGAGGMKVAFGQALAAFGVFGGALGAVFAGRAMKESIENEIKMAAEFDPLSRKTGMGAEALQAMGAYAQHADVDFNILTTSLTELTKNVGLFAAGAPTRLSGVFKALKIGVKDVKGMAPEDLFWKIGKGIASIADPTQKLAFAQRVFGESGALMLEMFHGTPAEIEANKKAYEELGVVYSETFVQKADAAEKKMELFSVQLHKIKVNLITGLLPAITWGAGKLIKFGVAVAKVSERTRIFQGAFISGGWMLFMKLLGRMALGGGGVAGALKKIFPFLMRMARVLAPWLAWTLILDDIMVFLRGGDSALGRFLETMFGAGTAAAVLQTIEEGWESIKTAIVNAVQTVRDWVGGLDSDGKRIVAILIGVGLAGAAGLMPLYRALLRITVAFIAGIVRAIGYGASLIATGISAGIASGGMWAFAAAAIAAGAAVAGIALALDQAVKLLTAVGGWEALGKGVKSFLAGRGFFTGVDEAANEKARASAKKRGAAVPFSMVPAAAAIGGVPPMLARNPVVGGALTINDNRSVEITVPANASPAQTGSVIAAAVQKAQPAPNLKAIQAALAGAPHG